MGWSNGTEDFCRVGTLEWKSLCNEEQKESDRSLSIAKALTGHTLDRHTHTSPGPLFPERTQVIPCLVCLAGFAGST